MSKHDGPARSHNGQRYPLGTLPREVARRVRSAVTKRVIKKQASRKTRYHKISADD